MKKMFKSIISFLLIMTLLLTPLLSTTISAVEEVSPGEISSADMNTATEIIDTGYSYGNYIEPDAVIPNPDYISPEENAQIQGISTNDTTSTMSATNGRLADGIYWINNAANGQYLDTQDGGVTSGTPVVQWIYSAHINGDENVYNRNQLFKVTYIGTNDGEDYYTIRPMTNNGLGLSAPTSSSSNLVDVKTMSTGETFYDITWYQKWVIKEYGYYYTIENRLVDENVFLAVPDGNNSNGSQIVMKESLTDTSLRAMWNFHPYTGPDIDGMGMIRFTTGVAKGSSFRYEAFSYSTTIGRNGPATFSVTDRNGNATNKATITSSSGTLRGIEMGEAQIRTTYSGAPWLWLWNVDIQFENGTYMFRTDNSGKYLESILSSNGNLAQGTLNGSSNEKWIFKYVTSKGYYQIKNKNTNLYLTSPNGTTGNITEQTYSSDIADQQLWLFTRTNEGYYKVQSKSKLGTNLVMSVGKGLLDGNIINQEPYSDDSDFKDEWLIHMQKDYILMYIGYQNGDPLMPPIVNSVSQSLREDAGMEGYEYTSLAKNDLILNLCTNNIFSCITHGLPNCIAATDTTLEIDDINNLSDGALNELTFVYLGACLTGAGGSQADNLVNSIKDKGATTVLGFKISVAVDETNFWTEIFMKSLATGCTVNESISEADISIRNNVNFKDRPFYTVGSASRYLAGSGDIAPCN